MRSAPMMCLLHGAFLVGILLSIAASSRDAFPQPVTGPRSKVESGLSLRVRIEGRPLDHWTLQDRMHFYGVPGVQIAVIDQGQVAWIGSYGVTRASGSQHIDDKTLFEAASLSKVVTALAVLRLVDKGAVRLDAPVRSVLRSWQLSDPSNSVTTRELLSHNAAINMPPGETALRPSQPIPTNIDRLAGRAPAGRETELWCNQRKPIPKKQWG